MLIPHLPLVSERGVRSISIFNAFVKVVANDNTFIPAGADLQSVPWSIRPEIND